MRKREKARPQVLRKFCPAFRAEEPWQLLPQAEPPPGCNIYPRDDILVMMMAIFLLFTMTMTVTMVKMMMMVMMMISHRTGPVKTRDTNCCHKMQEHLTNKDHHHHHHHI